MNVLSVNVGLPRAAEFNGMQVSTSIFKSAVTGRVAVRTLNIEGDKQSDLSVHGGQLKAVYLYPHEHHAYWSEQLGGQLEFGNFGENLTTEGILEDAVSLGDQLEIGTALFQVTQPRMPCYKLQFRFQREDMTKRFFISRKFGFYLAVLREGEIGAGDEIRIVAKDPSAVTVANAIGLFAGDIRDRELATRALTVGTLSTSWQEELRMRRSTWPEPNANVIAPESGSATR